jgi:hypothetical protein
MPMSPRILTKSLRLFLVPAAGAALAVALGAGCADRAPTDPTTDTAPLFAPGGGGPNQTRDLEVNLVAPENAPAVSGQWWILAYTEADGRVAETSVDCDATTGCPTATLTVPVGTIGILAFPGARDAFPAYVPIPPLVMPWSLQDVDYAAVVTCPDDTGTLPYLSCPANRGTFKSSFVIDIPNGNGSNLDPVTLTPPDAVQIDLSYLNLEAFDGSNDNNCTGQDCNPPRSASVVLPLCSGDFGWATTTSEGVKPAVPLTGNVANPASIPLPPPYDGQEDTCEGAAWVAELDFSGTPGSNGETLTQTYKAPSFPSADGTVDLFAVPLVCSLVDDQNKLLDASFEPDNESSKLEILTPIAYAFQADVNPSDLELTSYHDAVAGWFTLKLQGATTSGSGTFTLRNRSADGGTASLNVSFTCEATGTGTKCAESGSRSGSLDGTDTRFEINFRNAEGDAAEVTAYWSAVGLPFAVSGNGPKDNEVSFRIDTPEDGFPNASKASGKKPQISSAQQVIPYSASCNDNNDDRWYF